MRLKHHKIFDHIPLVQTLQNYNLKMLEKDALAGVNVALLAFPQGLAFALIAGLPVQYGVFGAAIAAVIGSVVSSTRYISLGPTNATAVMLLGAFISLNASEQMMLTLLPMILVLVGLFLIAAYTIRAASLIQYVSRSVITGYITAAAFLIVVNQLKHVLGFSIEREGATFSDILIRTVWHLPQTHGATLAFSILVLGVYILLKKWIPKLPVVALTLIIAALFGNLWNGFASLPQRLAMFPSFTVEDWSLSLPDWNFETISHLGSIALALAFLCLLEGVSIAKSLAARSGDDIDPNREMLSIGLANLACGLFSGMPASGSLTRSTLNWSSGAVTSISNLVNGVLCVLGATLLGPMIQYIPKAALAVIVIRIGISLIHWDHIRVMVKTTSMDRAVFIGTFLSALVFRLDTAIFFGTGLSVLMFLRRAAMPELVEYSFGSNGLLTALGKDQERNHPGISIVHVEGNLFFGAAELFRNQMRRIFVDPNLKVVVLKMRNALHLDATTALALRELANYMHDLDRHLLVCEIRPEVKGIFESAGLIETIQEPNIFPDDPRNPLKSTARAVARARELIGAPKVEVSILAEEPS